MSQVMAAAIEPPVPKNIEKVDALDEAFAKLLKDGPLVWVKKLIIRAFVLGVCLGISAAGSYVGYLKATGKWDASAHLFPAIVILFGLGFTVPAMTVTIRVMFLSVVMSVKAIRDSQSIVSIAKDVQQKAGPIIDKIDKVADKAVPMAENIEKIVEKAQGMTGDVVEIAHKTRSTIEQMNGSFNVKMIEQKMDQLVGSLATIAKVMAPLARMFGSKGSDDEVSVPEFDPLKAGGRRR